MRIEHLALSHLTCRIGGCLVPLELKGPEPQEETSNAHKLARLSTRYFWQLRCPYKHEKPLKHAGWLDNTIGGRGSGTSCDVCGPISSKARYRGIGPINRRAVGAATRGLLLLTLRRAPVSSLSKAYARPRPASHFSREDYHPKIQANMSG